MIKYIAKSSLQLLTRANESVRKFAFPKSGHNNDSKLGPDSSTKDTKPKLLNWWC